MPCGRKTLPTGDHTPTCGVYLRGLKWTAFSANDEMTRAASAAGRGGSVRWVEPMGGWEW